MIGLGFNKNGKTNGILSKSPQEFLVPWVYHNILGHFSTFLICANQMHPSQTSWCLYWIGMGWHIIQRGTRIGTRIRMYTYTRSRILDTKERMLYSDSEENIPTIQYLVAVGLLQALHSLFRVDPRLLTPWDGVFAGSLVLSCKYDRQ